MNRVTLILATAVLSAAFLSCGEEEEAPAPRVPDYSSPNAVLNTIAKAFNHGRLDWLDDALTTDFTFYFDPDDVGDVVNGYVIPPSWTYAEFKTACENMFAEAYSINFGLGEAGVPAEGVTEYKAEGVQLYCVVYIDPRTVYRTTYYCHEDFLFVKQASGSWRVARWWDFAGPFSGDVEPPSFGKILALFYAG